MSDCTEQQPAGLSDGIVREGRKRMPKETQS
jgi:hypothetical protein